MELWFRVRPCDMADGRNHMNSFNPNYFIHPANILLLVAYSLRDILWLRLFAVAAALISIPFTSYSRPRCGRLSFGVPSLRPSICSNHGVFSWSAVPLN